MKTREEIKAGKITAVDALKRIDKDCATAKWIVRRMTRKATPKDVNATKIEVAVRRKYKHKRFS